MDYQSWFDYNQAKNPLIEINGLTFVSAMNPPTGGKNSVSTRFLRHFNIIACNNFDEPTLERIYTKTMQWHCKKYNITGSPSSKVLTQLVGASVNIFLYCQQSMKPTPSKSHYLFNLRDLSRVIQGI
jgi:dynein heavy chain